MAKMKAEVSMRNWYVEKVKFQEGVSFNLAGDCKNHPVLGDTYVAYTSALEDAKLKDKVLYYETKNTIYICPLAYISIQSGELTVEEYKKELLLPITEFTDLEAIYDMENRLRLPKDSNFIGAKEKELLLLIQNGKKEIEEQKEAELNKLLKRSKEYPDSLYIEVHTIAEGDILCVNRHGKTECIKPYIHVGMFQDSILYSWEHLDFRYFPRGAHIDTYSWETDDECLKHIYVKNCKVMPIYFNNEVIEPDEVKLIESPYKKEEK